MRVVFAPVWWSKRNPAHAGRDDTVTFIRWEADAPMHCTIPCQILPKILLLHSTRTCIIILTIFTILQLLYRNLQVLYRKMQLLYI